MGAAKSKNGGNIQNEDLSLLTNFTADELQEVYDNFMAVICVKTLFYSVGFSLIRNWLDSAFGGCQSDVEFWVPESVKLARNSGFERYEINIQNFVIFWCSKFNAL